MARAGQIEFIDDLLEKHGLTRDDLALEEERWGNYEGLIPTEASELIDWLRDYPRSAG